MDRTAFETWLSEIEALTEPQRRRTWPTLALSETADSRDTEAGRPNDQGASGVAQVVAEPPPARPASQVGTPSVGELGQRRVVSVGCPHCDNPAVVR